MRKATPTDTNTPVKVFLIFIVVLLALAWFAIRGPDSLLYSGPKPQAIQAEYRQQTQSFMTDELVSLGLDETLVNNLTINCNPGSRADWRERRGYVAANQCTADLVINSHHTQLLDYKQMKLKILADGWNLQSETDYTKTQNSWGATSDYTKSVYALMLTESDGPNTSIIEIRREKAY